MTSNVWKEASAFSSNLRDLTTCPFKMEGGTIDLAISINQSSDFGFKRYVTFSTGWKLVVTEDALFNAVEPDGVIHEFLSKCAMPHPFRRCEAVCSPEAMEDEQPVMGKQVIDDE